MLISEANSKIITSFQTVIYNSNATQINCCLRNKFQDARFLVLIGKRN